MGLPTQSTKGLGKPVKLTPTQLHVIRALAQGCALRSHRYLNGVKQFRLYEPGEKVTTVRSNTMAALERERLIYSNHKFPAASYTLTDRGKEAAAALGSSIHGLSNIVHFDTRYDD